MPFPIAVRAWWTVYKNWRRRGAVRALADQLSVTLEQCQQQCINNSTCVAVTFDGNDPHSNNHCYLNFNRTAEGLSLFGTDLYELTRCGDAASKQILGEWIWRDFNYRCVARWSWSRICDQNVSVPATVLPSATLVKLFTHMFTHIQLSLSSFLGR